MFCKRINPRELLHSGLKALMIFPRCSVSESSLDNRGLMEIDGKFEKLEELNRKKEDLLAAIDLFRQTRGRQIAGQVEFIENVLKNLKDARLHKDLDIYKALLRVFPKDVLIPKNLFQRISYYYPVQQVCAVKLLDQMNWFGVEPDKEVYDIMKSRFGEYNWCMDKIKRLLYWMPKLKHTNKYLDRRWVENKNLTDIQLAKLALKMMCRDAGTKILFSKAQSDGSWILSAQSALQKRIISKLSHGTTCYVDGPFRVYVTDQQIQYLVFSAPPTHSNDEEWIDQRAVHDYSDLHAKIFDENVNADATMHHQSDSCLLSVAVLQQNTTQNASSWIESLNNDNPKLSQINVLFRLKPQEIPYHPWYSADFVKA